MYDLIRRIHLYSAFVVLSFLVMYFITGYPMIHQDFMEHQDPEKHTRVYPLENTGDFEPADYSVQLQDQFDLRGHRAKPRRHNNGNWEFGYSRPGTWYKTIVYAAGDSLRITEHRGNLRQTFIGFHRLHQYGGGALYDLWMVFYDLASLSLVVFAITGVYMWYTLTRKRLLGWLILGGSCTYAVAIILYLIYAP